jgi:hypothetical protein
MRGEIAKLCAILSVVIAREGGRSSIPETPMIEPKGRGVLDTPHSRGMTTLDYEITIAGWPMIRQSGPQ